MNVRFAVSYVKNGRIVSTYFDCKDEREEIRKNVMSICEVDINHQTGCYAASVLKLGQDGCIYQ